MQSYRRNYSLSILSHCFLGALMFLASMHLAVAELIMTAPPREQPEAGEKIYAPLAAHLTELLGEKVTYKHPKNWLEYQRDLRHDVYDIVFDGPHFVSWRVAHLNHDVLVKLPGTLEFVIVINKDDQDIKVMKDLVGKKNLRYTPTKPGNPDCYRTISKPCATTHNLGCSGRVQERARHLQERRMSGCGISYQLL